MALLAVVVIVIVIAGGFRVRRIMRMVVIVGASHRLAPLRAPIATSTSRSCEQKGLRLRKFSFPLQYEVCSHYRVKQYVEWDEAMSEPLKIGELATRTGCPVETIRYYEHEALLPAPVRSNGNYRLYGNAHVERLSFIRHCRSLDMTLDEIRTLLRFRDSPHENCDGANQLLDLHIGHVAARIADLNMLARQLKSLRRQCVEAKAAKDCGILNRLGETEIGTATANGRDGGHVHGSHPRRRS